MIKNYFDAKAWSDRLKKAVLWRIRAEENAHIESSSELSRWLEGSENRLAYERVSHLWKLLDEHKDTPDLLSLRHAALRNVKLTMRARWVLQFKLVTATAGCFAILAVLYIAWTTNSTNEAVTYSTEIGEQKVVTLDDGSHIAMDSSTIVRVVRFARHIRSVSLIKGRARFDVVHDVARPFTVAAGTQTVTAVGTSFGVERLSAKTLVTLDEGLVVVRELSPINGQSHHPIWLAPGQELVATQTGDVVVTNVDLDAANAWQHGQVVLADEPLDETVEQVNRYLTVPLEVDPAVAKMRVSGVFNVGKLNQLVSSLTSYFPLKSRLQNGRILLERRD